MTLKQSMYLVIKSQAEGPSRLGGSDGCLNPDFPLSILVHVCPKHKNNQNVQMKPHMIHGLQHYYYTENAMTFKLSVNHKITMKFQLSPTTSASLWMLRAERGRLEK